MFYVVTIQKAKEAIIEGLTIDKNNVVKEKDIVSSLNKIAFENNNAVLLKINDKIASSVLQEVNKMFIEPEDLEIIDTKDIINDEEIKTSYIEITSIIKLASIQMQKENKKFAAEYKKALNEAKSKNLKKAKNIAAMIALKKLGNNAC